MQICFYFPSLKNDQNNAIFGSMYSSFFSAIERTGINVYFTTELDEIIGDVLVVGVGSGGEMSAAKAMHKFTGPIIINIYNAYLGFNRPFLKRWSSRVLFAYNTDYSTLNYIKCASVNIKFIDIPFASDETIFYPIELYKKKYDITFLGNADSGNGRKQYIDLLIRYVKENNLKILLAGAGWEKYGFPYQIIKHGKETNEIYNESKVCVNIHNDRQFAGIDKEMDANNRLFDLAMAGCCQVRNGKKMIMRYFSEDELLTADNPREWLTLIDCSLKDEYKRDKIGINARKRALKDHTWDKRAIEFVDIVKSNYPNYSDINQNVNIFIKFMRFLDQFINFNHLLNNLRVVKYFKNLVIRFKN